MIASADPTLRNLVNLQSHQNINTCFICNKCTAGCPVAYAMEYGPHRILQMVRLGMKDTVLKSADIWLCACCETCGARCPNNVDIAHVMDVLRRLAIAEKVQNDASDIASFHQLFLGIVKTFGRMHEASLMLLFKFRTGNLLGDLVPGVQLIAKGKIPILPDRIKGASQVHTLLSTPEHRVPERIP